MKKVYVYAVCGALLLGSCSSYTGMGAYTGSQLGSILGSAIGGISDGPRGSDWGTIVGMAGGAIVGAAIGNAADKAQEQRIEQKREEIRNRTAQRQYENGQYGYQDDYDSGYDPDHRGDDRIDLNIDNAPSGTVSAPVYGNSGRMLEIRNVRFLDGNRNNVLETGEVGRIVFEVVNHSSSSTIYDVRPNVVEVTGNRQIFVSPDARVEQIGPGKGIRYTAMIRGGRRLKDGTAVFQIQATQGSGRGGSNVQEIRIPTRR